jgi:hypothetical protein
MNFQKIHSFSGFPHIRRQSRSLLTLTRPWSQE